MMREEREVVIQFSLIPMGACGGYHEGWSRGAQAQELPLGFGVQHRHEARDEDGRISCDVRANRKGNEVAKEKGTKKTTEKE